MTVPERYPFPWKAAWCVLRDAILLRPRDLRVDARQILKLLPTPPKVFAPEHIPAQGPCLLVFNHYTRPGFRPWWLGLGVSAHVPLDIHWLMVTAWTFPYEPLLRPLTPFTYWLFPRIAQIYGFTPMPPMPPSPRQVAMRATAVRRALTYVRHHPTPVVAMSPEGRDHPEGILGVPPPGVGRFMERLARRCQKIIPIGIYEDDEALCLNFGVPITLNAPADDAPDARDQHTAQQVMRAIAQQVPPHLRDKYG